MADGFSQDAANTVLAAAAAAYMWIQFHTGEPGSAGTDNAATNTTREQATWNSPSTNNLASTADITWTGVPATETYTHFTAWSASTGGTFGFSGLVTGGAVTSGANFTIPAGDLTASVTLAS